MAQRFYAVQFCDRRGGWTTIEHLGFRKEHEAIKVSKEISSLRPHFAMRVWQMSKSWTPSTSEDLIKDALAVMDRIRA